MVKNEGDFKDFDLIETIHGKSDHRISKLINKNKIKFYKDGFILKEHNNNFKILFSDITHIEYDNSKDSEKVNIYLALENEKIKGTNKRLLQINCDDYPYSFDFFKSVSKVWEIPEDGYYLPSTIVWFNITYILKTIQNGLDWHYIGGIKKKFAKNCTKSARLLEYLDVFNKETADKKIRWLLDTGYNTSYKKEQLSEASNKRIYSFYNSTAKDSSQLGLIGWDLCCIIQIAAWCYLYDFYPLDDAMDISLHAAKKIQQYFNSWDELLLNYLYGYEFCTKEDPNDLSSKLFELYDIFRRLKDNTDGPLKMDWYTELKKEW